VPHADAWLACPLVLPCMHRLFNDTTSMPKFYSFQWDGKMNNTGIQEFDIKFTQFTFLHVCTKKLEAKTQGLCMTNEYEDASLS
jgi:hypothetical protein